MMKIELLNLEESKEVDGISKRSYEKQFDKKRWNL